MMRLARILGLGVAAVAMLGSCQSESPEAAKKDTTDPAEKGAADIEARAASNVRRTIEKIERDAATSDQAQSASDQETEKTPQPGE